MAEIPNAKQLGGGDLVDPLENAAARSADNSEAVHQLCGSLSSVDLGANHGLLMRKIAKRLKRDIEQFEATDLCSPIILQNLKNTVKYIVDGIKNTEAKEIVEYVFAPEDRKQAAKRDRLNSCTISLDVNDLLNTVKKDGEIGLPVDMLESTVHYCTDCDAEIPVNEGEAYRDALVKHFTNDPHKALPKPPKPDVVLPTVSRKMATMMKAEPAGKEGDKLSESESFKSKLADALSRVELGRQVDVESLIAVYTAMTAVLTTKVSVMDLSTASKVITPILVSIKDNVNQSSVDSVRVNEEEDDGHDDLNAKVEPKKLKFYQPIASKFDDFLAKHKLISLTDERGGKPAYFCIPCEFYTLRFGYDTVVAHVLSDAHVQQLSKMLGADGSISHGFTSTAAPHEIHKLNKVFLSEEMWISIGQSEGDAAEVFYQCKLCKAALSGTEAMLAHVFDEVHMSKLSGKFFFKMREDKNVKWGQKNVDWKTFNVRNGKGLSPNQPIVLENFIKPLAKTLNQCQCCTMMLNGQRQLVFNHVRQKKHLRNAVPRRLTIAFSNFVRPLEYFSSLGHFYTCTLCEDFPKSAMLNFSELFQHSELDSHVNAVAKLLRIYSANFMEEDLTCLIRQGVVQTDLLNCILCGIQFATLQEVIGHIFTDIDHQNNVAARDYEINKPHLVNYLLKKTPIMVFNNEYHCLVCLLVMPTASGLLAHLSLADHVQEKLEPEALFRYYLLLKNNSKTIKENSIVVRDLNDVECQKCNCYLAPDENIRSHVISVKHKG